MNKVVLTLILMLALGGCSGLYHMPWENVQNKNVYNQPVYLETEKKITQTQPTVNSATQAKKTVKKRPVVSKISASNNKVVESVTTVKPIKPAITPVSIKENAINLDYKSKMVIPVE